jgi:hypothetical protein
MWPKKTLLKSNQITLGSDDMVTEMSAPNPPALVKFPKVRHETCDQHPRPSVAVAMSFTNTRCLLVGAGGIGCELLKTLCLHNLKEIFIVQPLISLSAWD